MLETLYWLAEIQRATEWNLCVNGD